MFKNKKSIENPELNPQSPVAQVSNNGELIVNESDKKENLDNQIDNNLSNNIDNSLDKQMSENLNYKMRENFENQIGENSNNQVNIPNNQVNIPNNQYLERHFNNELVHQGEDTFVNTKYNLALTELEQFKRINKVLNDKYDLSIEENRILKERVSRLSESQISYLNAKRYLGLRIVKISFLYTNNDCLLLNFENMNTNMYSTEKVFKGTKEYGNILNQIKNDSYLQSIWDA